MTGTKITWDRATATRFLGMFLTEPKPHVFLEAPQAPLSRAAFARRIVKHGVRVDRRVRLLYDPAQVYINGFAVRWPARSRLETPGGSRRKP